MKNLLLLIIILLFSACAPTSKLSKIGINYNEGDDLIYEVRAKDEDDEEKKYEIELNINGVSDNYVSYDWEIFPSRSGTISMTKNAINNAKTLYFFNENGYEFLEKETIIWISRTVFKELKAQKKVVINLEGNDKTFQMIGTETFSFGHTKEGTPYNVPVIIVTNPDASVEIWIANDAKNPIIIMIKMKNFRMDLSDYKLFK